MVPHLEERLQRDIDRIRDRLREMSDLAVRALEDSVTSLTTGDRKLAYSAILRDSRIDELYAKNDQQHRAIRQALAAGSAEGARALAREHVLSSFHMLEEILEQVGAKPWT